MLVQQNKENRGKLQAYLYDYKTCKPLITLTPDSIGTSPYSVTFNVDDTAENQQFIIGIKYSASSLVGQIPTGGSSDYNFQTAINGVYGEPSSWRVYSKVINRHSKPTFF